MKPSKLSSKDPNFSQLKSEFDTKIEILRQKNQDCSVVE